MKKQLLSLLVITEVFILTPSTALAEFYLNEKAFLRTVNNLLLENNNPLSKISNFDKLNYGQKVCINLGQGVTLKNSSEKLISVLASDKTISLNQKWQLINYDSTVTIAALHFFCPEYKSQIPS
ncbi:hypothetical protein [Nostoc sp. CHAB 5715]|uniref:hypothetical protein n=1 Tax=Nostoc sp. CHAB 5715 TaxID=2780400 RepID=UPI001E62BFD9|nr:hypothetical protein [Nostoc sp. CHAB 5715]MCC5623349.1 hypothetical protein [Nostoc sp. CHAB 5715]